MAKVKKSIKLSLPKKLQVFCGAANLGPLKGFLGFFDEYRKVDWIGPVRLAVLTAVVLLVNVTVALMMLGFDAVFFWLRDKFII